MCWIMDLECLYLVLRLWQRCIVTSLGPRQSSRLSFFPTRRLRRRLLLSRFSITSPLSSPVVVSSFFTSPPSPSPVFVFSVVPLRRLHFGISTLASAFVLQPWVLRPSFSSLALAWTLDRRREVLSQMQVLALRGGILAVTFVRRSLVFITIME